MEQLRRYLTIPDVDTLAYFRASMKAPPQDVLDHPKYLHPAGAAHFLWRGAYGPLMRGTQPLSIWLREGFEQLGYTPPLPHVGELVTDDRDESHAAQVNFGKLRDATGVYDQAFIICAIMTAVSVVLMSRVRQKGD